MSMLSSTLKTSVSRSNFHKTSKFSYSVWRSVKNEHAFDSSTKLACQNGVQKVLINFQCSPYIKNCSVNSRLVSTSVTRYKEPSSKVEETVERLKEKKKGDADTLETKILSESKEVDHAKKKSVWVSVKNVFKHYYSGFRLLFLDVKVSSKIVYKITRGKPLTRRESRQLVRTTSDLFRLVPFSIFIIIPFMEFALPLALKLFPGMLPSTFTSTSEREEKLKKSLQAKIEYTRFLQKTLDEMGPKGSGRTSKSAKEFSEFYQELKESYEDRSKILDNDRIMKFAKAFQDDITLDNMDRQQLSAICRLLNLTPIGTSNFLRLQIEMRLRHLRADDRLIHKEGMSRLSHAELQNANQERGMSAFGLSEERLKAQLGEWIDLSLNYKVPPSLLLLSRTLYNIDTLAPTQKIASAISALPEKAASATTATIGEREGKIRNVIRLEQIRDEERKIQEEAREKKKLDQLKKQSEKAATYKKEAAEEEEEEAVRLVVESTSSPVKKATVTKIGDVTETLVDTAPELKDTAIELEPTPIKEEKAEVMEEAKAAKAVKIEPEPVSTSSLSDLKEAIESLGMAKSAEETQQEIKKELEDYDEDVKELDDIKDLVDRHDLHESKAAKRLFTKVNKILAKTEKLVANLKAKETQIHNEMQGLGADDNVQEHEEKIVTIQELIEAVTRLQETPNQAKVDQIAQVLTMLDVDHDGIIKVDHVLKVIELLGVENTELPAKQIKQIISVLGEEEKIKVEDSIEALLMKKSQSFEDDEAFQQDLKALEDLATSGKHKTKGEHKKTSEKKESKNSKCSNTEEKHAHENRNGSKPH